MLEPKTFLTIRDLREAIQALFQTGQVSLPVESGIHLTDSKVGWQTIVFQKTFLTAPAVVAQGTFKAGSYLPDYKVDIPSITVPKITIPTFHIERILVPTVTIPTIKYSIPDLNIRQLLPAGYSTIAAYMGAEAKKAVDDLMSTPTFLAITIALGGGTYIFQTLVGQLYYSAFYFAGGFLDWFITDFLQPHFTLVEDIATDIRNKLKYDIIGIATSPKTGSINWGLRTLKDNIQVALDELVDETNLNITTIVDSTQYAIDTVSGIINESSLTVEAAIEDAVNEQIVRLYEFLGILDGAPMVPTKVQNVTNMGFQLYSTGASQYSWVAVGI